MPKILLILLISSVSSIAVATQKTICGDADNRVYVKNNTKVLRMASEGKYKGCTATMISRSCAITAGHCKNALYKGEINPPRSSSDSIPRTTTEDKVFLVDKDTIEYEYDAYSEFNGKDWAVFKFNKNVITGEYPGAKGNFYEVDFDYHPRANDKISMFGFGLDSDNPTLNAVLQFNNSTITSIEKNDQGELAVIQHTIDTMGGNSGSSILRKSSRYPHDEKIIGVHTNGGCYSIGGANEGTAIMAKDNFLSAIKKCLDSDR